MTIYSNALTANSVSIQSAEYGMRAYINSTRGRAQFEAEVPAEIVTEVYKTWGNTPTVTEPEPLPTVTPQPSIDDRILALEAAQLAALGV